MPGEIHVRAFRLDIGSIGEPQITPQGYLRTPAYATRVGVFSYRMPDGTVRKELRPPEEVFDHASLDTLAEIPVTNNHPPQMLSSKNTRKYAVGYTSKDVEPDSIFVKVGMTVTDQETIDQIFNEEKPKRQTSCGYTVELDESPGEWEGIAYDVVQRNIVYNHLAVVEAGRAGPNVGLKLDRYDAMMIDDEQYRKDADEHIKATKTRKSSERTDHNEEEVMAKIKIDGVEYEVSEVLGTKMGEKITALDKATEDLAKAQKALDELQGKHDGLAADLKKKDEEIEKAKKDKPSRKDMLDLARARMDLEEFAEEALGEAVKDMKFDEMEDVDIKKAVIAAVNPDMKLDEATDDYVNGCFSVILDGHKAGADKGDALEEGLRGGAGTSTKETDSATARADAMEHDSTAWQKGLPEYENAGE